MKKKILFLLLLAFAGFLSCYDDSILDTYNDSVIYNLRDRGPAGGWIFYINPNYRTDGWRYLEAAPADINSGGTLSWSNITGSYVNGVSALPAGIGTGYANTVAVTGQSGHTASAAKACLDYRGGGYSDWFLPSKDELYLMCWNLRGKGITGNNPEVPGAATGGIGNFNDTGFYWSSTEDPANSGQACDLQFGNANQSISAKITALYVRSIRAF